MSLAERMHVHSWISLISFLVSPPVSTGLAAVAIASGVAAGLAGCGARFAGEKLAASSYAPARAPEGHGAADHAAADHAAAPGPVELVPPDRPGLGTSWGEAVSAPITFAPFERVSARPWAELALHYNDAEGVMAHARYLGARPAPLEVYAGDGALSVALVDDAGRTLPGFTAGGRTLIAGEDGQRYRIVVHNATAARFEIVASVDGLDAIDGRPADPDRRGYLVDPHGVLTIDGFRTSDDAVAAFRFSRVAASYAAQTAGDRNVGVIGVAIFAERGADPRWFDRFRSAATRGWPPPCRQGPPCDAWTPGELDRRDTADPFPQRSYAVPPR